MPPSTESCDAPPCIVGLTGGIATGKSTVSRLLVARGAALIDADQVARDVVQPGTAGLTAVLQHFGEHLRLSTGELDRRALGALVFSDRAQLRALEQLLHPMIRAAIDARITQLRNQTSAPILIDAALLVEMQVHQRCDVVVVVRCGVETQLRRLMARDGLDEASARLRLAAQATDAVRLAAADHVIDNSHGLQELEQQVDALWQRLQPPGR